jgi:hypothetical protein
MPRIRCGKCSKPVEMMRIDADQVGIQRIVAVCHNAIEYIEVPARIADLEWWPSVVFAPLWKGFERYPPVRPAHKAASKCMGCRR